MRYPVPPPSSSSPPPPSSSPRPSSSPTPRSAATPTPGVWPVPAAPSPPWALLLRAAIAVGLLLGWVQLAHTPVQRSLDDFYGALHTGRVTSVTVERPGPGSQGQFPVEWEGSGRPGYASYEYYTDGDLTDPRVVVDEGAAIVRAAEQLGVEVTERPYTFDGGGFRWELGGIAWLAGLLLLVGGSQPRLATKWGWFWLALHVPPAMLAFVLLEPTSGWRRTPQPPARRRLTGGWAFLLALLAAGMLSAFPWYSEL